MSVHPIQPYDLGHYLCNDPHHALLHHVLDDYVGYWPNTSGPEQTVHRGVALEFGVGSGKSLNCISSHLPVIGFDSFKGLPEDWRDGYDQGDFAYPYEDIIAITPEHCTLVPGLFEDTLPGYCWEGMVPIRLVHIDCDLYSSTKAVLDNIPWPDMVRAHTAIVFDEWHGYPGAEQHEQRAWREFAERTGIQWRVLGHSFEQWGIQLV